MSEETTDIAYPGRLLLRLMARRDAEAMLPIATEFATAFGMQLSALFVEEQEALMAGALPLRNIVGFSGDTLPETPDALEEAMRREAKSCERLVREKAELARLFWSFRIERGASLALLRQMREEGDIVLLRFDRFSGGWREAVRSAKQLLTSTGGVLVFRDGVKMARNTVLFAGLEDERAGRGLALAARLADRVSGIVNRVGLTELRSGTVPFGLRPRFVVAEQALLDAAETEMVDLLGRLRAPLLVLE